MTKLRSLSSRAKSRDLHLPLSMVLFALATRDLSAQQPAAATEFAFEAPIGSKYEWLNKSVFVGVAERRPDAAIIRFYRVL